jgi:murein L,D-transpeptidase YcbB/YkuD
LEYYKTGKLEATHRVIVGQTKGKKIKVQGKWMGINQTPTLVSAIEQIIINPRWYVSDRIRLELNDEAAADPLYFSRHGYVQMSSAYPWGDPRLYQLPGPSNPLGRVKFEFSNPYAVYLHDTPKKQYFKRARRDLSHGCIRLDGAVEFAALLLKDDGNPAAQKMETYLANNKQVYFKLSEPVPIIIEYMPASSNERGQVLFCGDPYEWFDKTPREKV